MKIVIYVYDFCKLLDWIGPYDLLRTVPGFEVQVVSKEGAWLHADSGLMTYKTHKTLDEVNEATCLLVPGSRAGLKNQLNDPLVLEWIKKIDATSQWTLSVGEGSLLLGAAGLLQGISATSHWKTLKKLKKWGALPKSKRVVSEGKYMTAAGTSAGMDLALKWLEVVAGEDTQAVQKMKFDYAPNPPTPMGSPNKWGKLKAKQSLKYFKPIFKHQEKLIKGKTVKHSKKNGFDLTVFLCEGMRASDFIAPLQAMTLLPNLKLMLIGHRKGEIKVEGGGFSIKVPCALQDVKTSKMLLIPGGNGLEHLLTDQALLYWLSVINPTTQYTLTVGEGMQLLGVAGFLNDYDTWVEPVIGQQYGKYMLAKGPTQALDMALFVIGHQMKSPFSEAVQLQLEY